MGIRTSSEEEIMKWFNHGEGKMIVTLEYYHGFARILGEVRTGMGTAVVSYSGKIGSESLGGR